MRFFSGAPTHESQIAPGGRPIPALVKSRRVGFSSILVTTGSPKIPLTETCVTMLHLLVYMILKKPYASTIHMWKLAHHLLYFTHLFMIEVEIRGRITPEELEELKTFLSKNGTHVESHEREMILLRGYPGYTEDFVDRPVDIRLRNTDGNCEIMLKRNVEGSDSRKEYSLKLQDASLETAREVAKGFGCTDGILMQRSKDVFIYDDIEWSLVKTPKGHYYYEAEMEAEDEKAAVGIREKLVAAATSLDLECLGPDETRAFIHTLDTEVNEKIEL